LIFSGVGLQVILFGEILPFFLVFCVELGLFVYELVELLLFGEESCILVHSQSAMDSGDELLGREGFHVVLDAELGDFGFGGCEERGG
jgi:hypothetical protein